MSPYIFFLAASVGLGLWMVVLGLLKAPQEPTEAGAPEPKDETERTIQSAQRMLRRLSQRVEAELGGKTAVKQDLEMVGRSLEAHAVVKLAGLGIGAATGAFFGTMSRLAGLNAPVFVIVILAAGGAYAGWWLPDSILKSDADKERVYFQQVTDAWLELVAQLVTAGADTFGALYTAATFSEQPVFKVIREALRSAAASGDPPWEGLRKLAETRRLKFLEPFCAALELSGTTGAGSRQSILSQVESTRSKALHEADAAAASSGEKMGAPLALIGGAFMILMGYPPLAGIMESATLTGPGL